MLTIAFTLYWSDVPWLLVLATGALWVGYLALTNLNRARHAGLLTPAARVAAVLLLAVFGVLDVLVNWTVGTVVFFDIPRQLTLSARCKRHYLEPGLRGRISRWLGRNALNPFDHTGNHLD